MRLTTVHSLRVIITIALASPANLNDSSARKLEERLKLLAAAGLLESHLADYAQSSITPHLETIDGTRVCRVKVTEQTLADDELLQTIVKLGRRVRSVGLDPHQPFPLSQDVAAIGAFAKEVLAPFHTYRKKGIAFTSKVIGPKTNRRLYLDGHGKPNKIIAALRDLCADLAQHESGLSARNIALERDTARSFPNVVAISNATSDERATA